MIRQRGPIAYRLQPPVTVRMACTGESGLARIDAAVHECSDKLAVPVLGGSSPAVHLQYDVFPLFPYFYAPCATLCCLQLPLVIKRSSSRVIGKIKFVQQTAVLFTNLCHCYLSQGRAMQTGIFGGTECNHRE